jgi:preprotein translocase subunit SecE
VAFTNLDRARHHRGQPGYFTIFRLPRPLSCPDAPPFGGLTPLCLEFRRATTYIQRVETRSSGKCPMARTNPLQFAQQVRSEVAKVVWPTRRETTITTIMVFIMAFFASLFFFLIDQIVKLGLTTILG